MSAPFTVQIAKTPSRWRPSLQALRIPTHTRNYAVQAPGRPTLKVFNQAVKHMQKDRAAQNVEQSRQVDYIKDEVAKRLCERLLVRTC
jgi:NADH dehydrogenase [ubiquinone] 1 alpha subcomplex assembly factor 5